MSPFSIVLFCIMFSSAAVLWGKYYEHFHVSYGTWKWITIVLAAVFVVVYLLENFVFKKKSADKEA